MSDGTGIKFNRRDLFKIAGTGAAASGFNVLTPRVVEKIVPYLNAPEDIVVGTPTWYASTCRECAAGCGVLVKTREGRAIKIEGNPDSPVNAGKLCGVGHAALQGLYNPDRIRKPLVRDGEGFREVGWEEAEKILSEKLAAVRAAGRGKDVAVISGHVTGSMDALLAELMVLLGSINRLNYEPFAYESIKAANKIVFNSAAIPSYRFAEARTILAIGADVLETWLNPVSNTAGFAKMHAPTGPAGRLVVADPRLSVTAGKADEWLAIKPGSELSLVLGILHAIVDRGLATGADAATIDKLKGLVAGYTLEKTSADTDVPASRIEAVAAGFAAGPAVAVGGGVAASGSNATAVQVAINLLNVVTGNIGKTVVFGPNQTIGNVGGYADLLALAEKMNQGQIAAVVVHNSNPAYSTPRKAGIEAALKKVDFVVSFSSYLDETAALAHLVLPDNTPLESWGDHEAVVGVVGLQQPAMRPVFDTQPAGDVLLRLARSLGATAPGLQAATFYDYLQARWQQKLGVANFEKAWIDALAKGGVFAPVEPQAVSLAPAALSYPIAAAQTDGEGEFDLVVFPSIRRLDGRGANRPWLQEVPDPMTTLVWDSWLEVHPETARKLGIAEGDLVEVKSAHGTLKLGAYAYPGARKDVVALALGQGHTKFGRYAERVGVNALDLLSGAAEAASGAMVSSGIKVQVVRVSGKTLLSHTQDATTQGATGIGQVIPLTDLMAGRKIGAEHALGHYSHVAFEADQGGADMYPGHDGDKDDKRGSLFGLPRSPEAWGIGNGADPQMHAEYRWGMAIDLDSCTGCGACSIACYAENNLPIIGHAERPGRGEEGLSFAEISKMRISEGREMSWIRIERYWDGNDAENRPSTMFVPMLCQHCNNAPCETVCPALATYHTLDGVNGMVYNRCIGTRYCSNNCSYKVRRFNWLDYKWPEPLNWQLNPEVTVRSKGVMEKCTFCIQRTHDARQVAKRDGGRLVRDGEVTSACAQTCPADAIVFGNLKDPNSRVSQMHKSNRGYRVLDHLNTEPAIVYLAKASREV